MQSLRLVTENRGFSGVYQCSWAFGSCETNDGDPPVIPHGGDVLRGGCALSAVLSQCYARLKQRHPAGSLGPRCMVAALVASSKSCAVAFLVLAAGTVAGYATWPYSLQRCNLGDWTDGATKTSICRCTIHVTSVALEFWAEVSPELLAGFEAGGALLRFVKASVQAVAGPTAREVAMVENLRFAKFWFGLCVSTFPLPPTPVPCPSVPAPTSHPPFTLLPSPPAPAAR